MIACRVPEVRATDKYPDHQTPLAFSEVVRRLAQVERDSSGQEVFLYHGTNCWRRWEMNRSGNLLPGRTGYSFYCTNEDVALGYAKNASLRDVRSGASNSLTCEPVVLKVKFTARTWLQVDFVQELPAPESKLALSAGATLNVAVLGPVPFANVVEVKHCLHGRKSLGDSEAVRSFADGKLMAGIRRLRKKSGCWRFDAYALNQLENCSRKIKRWLSFKPEPRLTFADELNRLAQVGPRLRLRNNRFPPA